MRKSTLLEKFKKQFDGEVVRERGKWYWIKEDTKHIISTGWLVSMLKNKATEEVNPVEIQQYEDKIVVENVGIETPVEEQKPENDATAPSELTEEEIKALKNAKRREKRRQRKLEEQKKQNDTE